MIIESMIKSTMNGTKTFCRVGAFFGELFVIYFLGGIALLFGGLFVLYFLTVGGGIKTTISIVTQLGPIGLIFAAIGIYLIMKIIGR